MLSRERRLIFAISILSLIQLAFELIFVKLAFYEFTTLALVFLGLALLGVALAAPLAEFLIKKNKSDTIVLSAFPLMALLTCGILFSQRHLLDSAASHSATLAFSGVAALITLGLLSVPLFLRIRITPERTTTYYTASLIGAALGAPLALGVLSWVGDFGACAFFLSLYAVPALLLIEHKTLAQVMASMTVALGLFAAWALPALDHRVHPNVIFTGSDAFSRVDVVPVEAGRYYIREGGKAGAFKTAGCPPQVLRTIPRASKLLPSKNILFLGSGAGGDIWDAIGDGATQVTAVEINPLVSQAMEKLLPPECNPYHLPQVRLILAEARESAARELLNTNQRYDLINVTATPMLGGNSGHLFSASYLKTREAYVQYAPLLSAQGAFEIAVAYRPKDTVIPKHLRALRDALTDLGVSSPLSHIFALVSKNIALLITRPHVPFTLEERAQLLKVLPDAQELPVADLVEKGDGLRPYTDDIPFLRNERSSLHRKSFTYDEWLVPETPKMLLAFLGLFLLAALLSLYGLRTIGDRPRALGLLAASSATGAAYVIYETALLQRLVLFLGHPVTATAVVLSCALMGTALGAYFSERGLSEKWLKRRVISVVFLVLWLVGTALMTLRPYDFVSLPYWSRIVFAALLSIPPFVVVGRFFPSFLRQAAMLDPRLVGRCWILNGLASIVGSVFVILGSMAWGFKISIFTAAFLYSIILVWEALQNRSPALTRVAGIAIAVLVVGLFVASAVGLWVIF